MIESFRSIKLFDFYLKQLAFRPALELPVLLPLSAFSQKDSIHYTLAGVELQTA